ncbi:MAG: ABC transporter substrate-binding protein [Deltaproteobacteria bacterium]|nr:ABC transporter substrate-binding protein [Deltaproteobacteria bacterium]
MKKTGTTFLAFLAFMLLTLSFQAYHAEAGSKILKIGTIFPLTGPAAPGMGPEATDGVRAAADWINEKGGISIKGQKYKMEIIAEDNKSTPEGTVAAANKLIFSHKVKFISGPIIPWLNIAMTPVSEQAKVLRCLVDGTGTLQEMNTNTKYTFAPFFELPQIPPIYDHAVKSYPGVRKMAIVNPDEPGGHFFAAVCKKAAEKRGLKVVQTVFYPFDTKDFYPIWTKMLAQKPDAVDMGLGIPPWYAAIIKQGRELGFSGPILTPSAIPDVSVFVKLVGKEYADKILFSISSLYNPEASPVMEAVKKHILGKYSSQVVEAHLGGWSSLWCIAQAIEEAQSLDTTVVAETWRRMKRIETLNGPATMGGQDVYGINNIVLRPVGVGRIKKGEVKFIGYFPPRFPELP